MHFVYFLQAGNKETMIAVLNWNSFSLSSLNFDANNLAELGFWLNGFVTIGFEGIFLFH